MENDNKDIFDYDRYVKANGKKKKKKNRQKKQNVKFVLNNPDDQKKPERRERSESIENIRRMFDDALGENAADMAELTSGEPVPEITVTGIGKRRLYMILGTIISVLAIIGFISVVRFSVDKVRAFADNTQQKNEFAKFIYPIVICDPAPFDQTVKLLNDKMLTAAIWDIIMYEDKSKYTSDYDYIIVPELDVEQHATKLFGDGLNFTHASILGADVSFYYEEEKGSYRIPSNPKYFTYSPYIENITRVGERYTLTVGYVSPTPAWLTLTSDEAPSPEKYVEYVVSKRGNEYTLVAIQQSEKQVLNPLI